MRKLLLLCMLLLCAVAATWADDAPTVDVTFENQTASNYFKTYDEGVTLISSDQAIKSSSGTYYTNNVSSNVSDYNSNYMGVVAAEGKRIVKVAFLVSANSSSATAAPVYLGWSETPSNTNVAFYKVVNGTKAGNTLSSAEWLECDLSGEEASIQQVRIYRKIAKNKFSTDGGTTYLAEMGGGQTCRIWGFRVWLDNSASKEIASQTLKGLKLGETTLAEGTDYTASGNTLTLADAHAVAAAPTNISLIKHVVYADNETKDVDVAVAFDATAASGFFSGTAAIGETTYTVKVPKKTIVAQAFSGVRVGEKLLTEGTDYLTDDTTLKLGNAYAVESAPKNISLVNHVTYNNATASDEYVSVAFGVLSVDGYFKGTATIDATTYTVTVPAVPSAEPYFIQTFDEYFVVDGETLSSTSTYPAKVTIDGQEWEVSNAYVVYGADMKTNYVKDGSRGDLRMAKNGGYIITPVLNKGVKKIVLDENRGSKYLDIYTSTNGGSSWTLLKSFSKNTTQGMTIEVGDLNVNRVKIVNPNSSNDCDIDNLAVYPEAYGTPAQVSTGDASAITKNTAVVAGAITDRGDQPTKELGVVYGTNSNPSVADSKAEVENPASTTSFSLDLSGLKASTTYYYRAYAFSNAGYVYGDVKSFATEAATAAEVATAAITYTSKKDIYVSGGTVTDDGGADLTEVGIVYAETAGVTLDNGTKVAADKLKPVFTVTLPAEQGKTYYVRAYATTTVGTSLGNEVSATIDENVPESPDLTEKIWCAPDGDDATADGSETKPFYTLDKAIALVEPGQRICMKAGTYVYDHRININDTNGTPDEMIELFAVPYNGEERAVLDFSAQPYHAHSDNPYQGIRLTSSYWHFYKIDICNASDNGLLIERNKPTGGSAADIIARTQDAHDNIIEECNFYKNGDTGLQIKNLGSYNKIINCDSYLNCDEDNGDADGFAPKISVGDGNYFYGCRAWLNSDDGYDVFFKKDGNFEDNKTIIFENCIASRNGKFENGSSTQGNANGFKMGSNQGRMNVVLNRCIASCNGSKGFDQNHNTGDIIMNNCTGFTRTDQVSGKSVKYSYSYKIYEALASGSVCQLNNCIAINDNYIDGKDQNGVDAKKGKSEWGGIRVDESIATLTTSNLKSDPTWFVDLSNFSELEGARDADGNIPETTFAHIDGTRGTALIDAGTIIGENNRYASTNITIPAIAYEGAAPDLGAYEYKDPTGIGRIASAKSNGNRVSLAQCNNGLIVVSVEGASATDVFQLTATDAAGKTIGQYSFRAAGSIRLPAVKGIVLLHVSGNQLQETIKTIVK